MFTLQVGSVVLSVCHLEHEAFPAHEKRKSEEEAAHANHSVLWPGNDAYDFCSHTLAKAGAGFV